MNQQIRGISPRRIYAGALVALLALLVVIVIGYKSLDENKKSADWVTHTLSVITLVQRLETEINELGISQRGYILTSQKRHLDQYNKLLPEVNGTINEVRRTVIDHKEQLERLSRIESLLGDLKRFYSYNMDDVTQGRSAKAVHRVKKGLGQDTLDDITRLSNEMISVEENLLNTRISEQKKISDQSTALILGGSIFAFLLVMIASFLIVAEFRRRMKIQSDLNQTTQIQKAILDSAAFALIAGDKDGRTTLFNPAAERLLGYTAEEVLGQTPERFHVKEEVENMARRLSARFREEIEPGYETFVYRAKKGIVEADQWTYIRKDGKRIPVNLSVTAQRDQNGEITGYLGIAYDISKQLEYEDAIIKAKELALAGTQAKSEFLANMSHEIRTPMNAIMGMAELLNETRLDEEQKKYVDVFKRAGESLLNIINDILDLSKIEAGHFELDKTTFSLSEVVDKSSEIMALKAHQKHIELAVDIDQDLHDHYIGDPNRIRQILLNLLGNAIKFTKRGEVLLRMYAGKHTGLEHEIVIEVQDTGIGMNEEQLSKLFERFNQADSSITKEYGGTGLGLSITKRLVEFMNGSIDVQSSFGIGTKFTVTIKLLKDDVQEETVSGDFSLQGKRILIVDDTKTNRFILKKIIDHQGAVADEAIDGEKALEMIHEASKNKTPYDLVLLDCRMPGIDGFKVAEKVQSTELKGPLIMMLTSDNRPGDLARSKTLGLKSYLVKPVLKQELLAEINRAMNLSDKDKAPEVKVEPVNKPVADLRILLVDDNDENRLVIRSFIKAFPWKVDEARNGKEALSLFKNGKYDVILMDMQMPVMDGYTATKELRQIEILKRAEPTPVLALTAYALKDEIDKSLEAGCNGHLSKPVSKVSLIKCIEEFTKEFKVIVDKDLEDLIPEYLQKRSSEVLELKAAFERNDYPYLQAIGHKLRGSAGSYGFSDLSEIGKEIEEKSKVMDSVAIGHALNQYQLYLKRIKVTFE